MSRDSASDTDLKERIEALKKENLRLKKELEIQRMDKLVLAEKLRLSEEVLSTLNSGFLAWKFDADSLSLSNPGIFQLSEHVLKPQDLLLRIREMLHPADYLGLLRQLVRVRDKLPLLPTLPVRVCTLAPAGAEILLRFQLQKNENEEPDVLMVIYSPVTNRPASLSDLTRELAMPYLRFSADTGKLSYTNPEAEQLMAAYELQNSRFIADLMGPAEEAEMTRLLHEEQVIEQLKIGRNGLSALMAARMQEDEVEALLIDMTDYQSRIDSLLKVNHDLDNFVYHASHDLRAPLRTVLGLLDVLKLENSKAERERSVDLIKGSIRRLDTLVVDLLSISRNNRRHHPLMHINFMVEVDLAVSNFYQLRETKDLEIITKISQPVPFVADLTRLRIILNNLVSNALKYRRFYIEYSFVEIRIEVDRQAAYIEIEDNGEGIPEDKQGQIFDMFVRASERSEGSGLGLYIVRDVLEKMGGRIDLKSTFDQGTTFTLEVPNQLGRSEEE